MTEYKAPLREIDFVLNELLDVGEHYQNLVGAEEATPDMVSAIVEEAARFVENEIAPLNRVGDQQGCHWQDGTVTTPDGFVQAYQRYVEGGWPALAHDPQWGGQGLPESLGIVVNELLGTANWAWSMYPGLCHGAMNTLEIHGTKEQKELYLKPLVEGRWMSTMCLTESHCGTDLGLLRTKAEPQKDGSFRISGTKIFISAGEHDLTENIIHIVLARLPDAPEGTEGISLFIVPKYLPEQIGVPNGVSCGSLENKMGIHGNATCVMNFDGATGYLIGPANKGLKCMFTFMNTARIGTALQGLAHAEWGFQHSLSYAKDRLQMRSLTGVKAANQEADPIIVHPEVRKMLLTQKAFAEGGRALIYYCAQLVDKEKQAADAEESAKAEQLLAFLTPIAKAFLTEVGFESANHALQIYGGHGYIAEWGMEQNVRDSRISMLYEGTTQIQALDLLGRKVLLSRGKSLRGFTQIIDAFCQDEASNAELSVFITELKQLNEEWLLLTREIGMKALKNRDEVGAASVDYLMYSGYVTLAYFWARMASIALYKQSDDESGFYRAKWSTAQFYFQRILPRTRGLVETMRSGSANLMELEVEHFSV